MCVALLLPQPSLLKEWKEWSCSPPATSLELFFSVFLSIHLFSLWLGIVLLLVLIAVLGEVLVVLSVVG